MMNNLCVCLVIIITSFLFTACYTNEIACHEYLSADKKQILLPFSANTSTLENSIQQALRNEGWKIQRPLGMDLNSGRLQETALTHTQAPYLLLYKEEYVDREIPSFEPMYNISLNIFNLQTGNLVLSIEMDKYTPKRLTTFLQSTLQAYTQ